MDHQLDTGRLARQQRWLEVATVTALLLLLLVLAAAVVLLQQHGP